MKKRILFFLFCISSHLATCQVAGYPVVSDTAIHNFVQKYVKIFEIPEDSGVVVIDNFLLGDLTEGKNGFGIRWRNEKDFLRVCRVPDWVGFSGKMLVYVYVGDLPYFIQPEGRRTQLYEKFESRFIETLPPTPDEIPDGSSYKGERTSFLLNYTNPKERTINMSFRGFEGKYRSYFWMDIEGRLFTLKGWENKEQYRDRSKD